MRFLVMTTEVGSQDKLLYLNSDTKQVVDLLSTPKQAAFKMLVGTSMFIEFNKINDISLEDIQGFVADHPVELMFLGLATSALLIYKKAGKKYKSKYK